MMSLLCWQPQALKHGWFCSQILCLLCSKPENRDLVASDNRLCRPMLEPAPVYDIDRQGPSLSAFLRVSSPRFVRWRCAYECMRAIGKTLSKPREAQ